MTTLGILGGGQLGRMLALAAARLEIAVVILDPDRRAPAATVAGRHLIAPYDDTAALAEMASCCDVITYEFENIPTNALTILSERLPIRPDVNALSIAQDRLIEKQFFTDQSIAATAEYRAVGSQSELELAVAEFDAPVIAKTRRFGYDGKGQLRIDATPPADAFERLGSQPLIVEAVVDFVAETSVIIARDAAGECVCYDPGVNDHVDGILRSTEVPGELSPATIAAAETAARALVTSLDYVGVLGLELFVLADGSIVANEFAPRVHNSGHWTEAGCTISQFEQHVRAVTGGTVIPTRRHSDATMRNLIGDEISTVDRFVRSPDTVVHLYGKSEIRPGRKMGHITSVRPRSDPAVG